MRILGIAAYYHDSSVCLLEDGKIIYAAQEERFSRIKNDSNFPILALQNCLSYVSICLNDIDIFVYYEKPFLKLERILKMYLNTVPFGLRSFMAAMQNWTSEKLFIKNNIHAELSKIDNKFRLNSDKLLFCEHHLSHAASAFFPSPFKEAAILCIDGVGEYTTTSLSYGNENEILSICDIHFPDSLGLFYSAITYFLGFEVNKDEYKVMGLAAYGNPECYETTMFLNIIEEHLITIHHDGSFVLNQKYFAFAHSLKMVNDIIWKKLFSLKKRNEYDELTQSHCNLAFAFQKTLEKAVLNLCFALKEKTNSDNLCLAGGVALNSVINGIISDKKIFNNIFIQPASGDAGGSLGCAMAVHYIFKNNQRTVDLIAMKNALLGNSFTDNDISELAQAHSKHEHCNTEDELCKKVAQLLAEGKVIGWFQGRMEFGPRALGNRSILADARNADMQYRLNMKIKNRESFRPFAPAVMEEDAHLYFDMEGISPYMMQVHKVKSHYLKCLPAGYAELHMKEKLYTVKSEMPAVTHVDMSARIQTVNKEQHPLFWKLINSFKDITSLGMVINTSFNVKDEPIVCSLQDAYSCFIRTEMDILVLGKYIFYK